MLMRNHDPLQRELMLMPSRLCGVRQGVRGHCGPVLAFWVLLIMSLLGVVRADIVHLIDGGQVEGTVVDLGDKLKIEFPNGSVVVNKSDVAEIEKKATPQQVFASKLAAAGDNAGRCVAVGRWARGRGMDKEYVLALRRALQLDPEHEVAQELLYEYQIRFAFLPYDDAAIGRLADEMGRDFRVIRTQHYRICYNGSDIYADVCSELLEKVYGQFMNFFEDRNFDPAPLTDRLEVMLFDSRQEFIAYAQENVGAEMAQSAGFYSFTKNRSFFYDAVNDRKYQTFRVQLEQAYADLKQHRQAVAQNAKGSTRYRLTNPDGTERIVRAAELLREYDRHEAALNQQAQELRQQYCQYGA